MQRRSLTGNKLYANEILGDIECYKAVLDGRLKRFPRGFWEKPWSYESAALITRYLLEDRLNIAREDICKKANLRTFKDSKLGGMAMIFNNSFRDIINNAYPNEFQSWELCRVSTGYWDNPENIKKAVRWIVETKLGNDRQRVCKEFNQELLKEYNLVTLSNFGLYNVLDLTYPNEFQPWELSRVQTGYWNDPENISKAIRWLVKNKLGNSRERVCKEFTNQLLKDNNLSTLLVYGQFNLLNKAYPNEFKPWEIYEIADGYWNDIAHIKKAIKWITQTKLDSKRSRVEKEFTREFLIKNSLETLTQKYSVEKLKKIALGYCKVE